VDCHLFNISFLFSGLINLYDYLKIFKDNFGNNKKHNELTIQHLEIIAYVFRDIITDSFLSKFRSKSKKSKIDRVILFRFN